jgi:hypothetical protein
MTVLRECVLECESDKSTDPEVKARIKDVLEFTETLSSWYEQIRALPRGTLIKLIRMGAKVAKFLGKK